MDGFELYYIDVDENSNDKLLTYSARGTMGFPTENTWITLTQTHYYNGSNDSWEPGAPDPTPGAETIYAKYSFTDDGVSKMDVSLDMTAPADVAEYMWNFTKTNDSVKPLY